jgi:hypothetical protein
MRLKIIVSNVFVGLLLAVAPLAAESAGGMSWKAPQGWQASPPRPMRAATYVVPPAAGDSEPGECGVFYFGRGQGGGVDDNIARWASQFRAPAGGDLDVKRGSETVGGLKVTTVDLSGTFLWKPRPAAPQAVEKPGFRLLGAIVEGPEGAVFFKLTAPAATVAAAEGDFRAMLASLSAAN